MFPVHSLKTTLDDPSKQPLVIVACGSYSPITYLHLRMLEMAQDYLMLSEFELCGGYFSPVSDAYAKPGVFDFNPACPFIPPRAHVSTGLSKHLDDGRCVGSLPAYIYPNCKSLGPLSRRAIQNQTYKLIKTLPHHASRRWRLDTILCRS